jgi:hypothetical protein
MTLGAKKESEELEDELFAGIPSFVDREALVVHTNRPQNGLHAAAFEAFYEEFVSDSDRAAVILGAAKIDDILGRILSAHLVLPFDEKSDELLSTNGPLGTMSARIDMVFRLGLISKEFRRSLHLIRKIRNTFAHDLEGCSFETASIRSQTNELFAPYDGRLFTKRFMRRFGSLDSHPIRFRTVLAIHMHRLNMICEIIKRIDGSEAYPPLMPNWERLKEKGLLHDEDLHDE